MKTIQPYESRRLGRETHSAANEDRFPGDSIATLRPASKTGWDPYDIWRTRVKNHSRPTTLNDPA